MPPLTRVCHVCGRQYGLSSFDIHLKQCKKLWLAQEEKKPPNERREIPKTPPGLDEALEAGGKTAKEALEAINKAASETFNEHGMEKCQYCGRTFAEGRLAIHNRSCRPDSVARKVEEGVAPRNKKVLPREYGRVRKASDEGESSDGGELPTDRYTSDASAPLSSDNTGGVESSASGSPPLTGTLASNRKRNSSSAQKTRLRSPLAPANDPSDKRETVTSANECGEDRRSQEEAIRLVQSKLDHWESLALSMLKEIRQLKQQLRQ